MQASHYNFEVTPTVKNGKVASWELCFVGPRTPHNKLGCGEDADVYIPMNQSHQSFKYTITGDPGLGLTFAPNPPPSANAGPIWIQLYNKPTSRFVHDDIISLNAAGGTLTFVDKNDTAGVLEYQLNFIDKYGNKSALDPDIINGGKGLFGIGELASFLIGAAVAASLLSFWFVRARSIRHKYAKTAAASDSERSG